MVWSDIKVGDMLLGIPIKKKETYALLLFEGGITGLLHRKEMPRFDKRPFHEIVEIGVCYKVKVLEKDEELGEIRVSLRHMTTEERKKPLAKALPSPSQISFLGLKEALETWCKEEKDAQ